MDTSLILAAPQVVSPAKDAAQKFVDLLIGNSTVQTLLIVVGGCILACCIVLLVARKAFPNTAIGQIVHSSGGVIWCVMFMMLSLMLIMPSQLIPFVVQIFAAVFQALLDILGSIFGF